MEWITAVQFAAIARDCHLYSAESVDPVTVTDIAKYHHAMTEDLTARETYEWDKLFASIDREHLSDELNTLLWEWHAEEYADRMDGVS